MCCGMASTLRNAWRNGRFSAMYLGGVEPSHWKALSLDGTPRLVSVPRLSPSCLRTIIDVFALRGDSPGLRERFASGALLTWKKRQCVAGRMSQLRWVLLRLSFPRQMEARVCFGFGRCQRSYSNLLPVALAACVCRVRDLSYSCTSARGIGKVRE